MSSRIKTLIHAMLLNALWFSVVLGVAYQHKLTALAVFVCMVLVTAYEGWERSDWMALLIGLLVGAVLDGFLRASGWIDYGQWFNNIPWLPPYWIFMLWMGFALSLKIGMRWLFKHYWLGAAFLIIGAPLSYFSADKLGAVVLQKPTAVMLLIAVGWWFYFSVLYGVNKSWRNAYES
ncbi:membrane protein [Marinicella pacifica]|uniref:Membrane protein n=1 Tax=Marinicella pacifica TaxID=1171543 RepID=A0A917CWZ7_9GAMM|nr:DUF2878 domain-containing protein [Marinicella pacifica]GGG01834.1 membrane protein [Marinicella pacifica]